MNDTGRLARTTTTLVVVGAAWLLLYSGTRPNAETGALLRAFKIALALGLVVGLIPGMFLNAWIVGLSNRTPQARRGLLLGGVVIPFLVLALFLTWILADLKFLSSVRELGLGAEGTQWRLIRNGGTALVWLAMVILNGLNVLSPRRSAPHQERPTG
jgi:hypothetical protein